MIDKKYKPLKFLQKVSVFQNLVTGIWTPKLVHQTLSNLLPRNKQ